MMTVLYINPAFHILVMESYIETIMQIKKIRKENNSSSTAFHPFAILEKGA